MKTAQRIYREPEGHWVGDGFPVRTVLDYQRHPECRLSSCSITSGRPISRPRKAARRGLASAPRLRDRDGAHGRRGRARGHGRQWRTHRPRRRAVDDRRRGTAHKEFHSQGFTRRGGRFHGLQLWVNLPARHKMTPPRYQTLRAADIPVVDGVRVIAGESGKVRRRLSRRSRSSKSACAPRNRFTYRSPKLTAPSFTSFRASFRSRPSASSCFEPERSRLRSRCRDRRHRLRDERHAARRAGRGLWTLRHEYAARNSAGVRRLPGGTPWNHPHNGENVMIDHRTAPYAALAARLARRDVHRALARAEALHATLPGTAQFFASIGLPAALAYLTFWAELIGGLRSSRASARASSPSGSFPSCSAPPGCTPATAGCSAPRTAAGSILCS